ncbi:MAG: YncE family protein, partial [Pseudomonadota bacterium]
MNRVHRTLFLLATALLTLPFAAHADDSGYHVLKSVTLGGDGGFDYLNLDPASGYLYITRGS